MSAILKQIETDELDEAAHRADLIGRAVSAMERREALARAALLTARAAWCAG